nr:hypothetical protein [Tanacetum cinerariifolium]
KLSKRFEKLMHNKFEMSMMGELKFFLGIQFQQSLHGIFINQAKYAHEILNKHGMTSCDSIGTQMATKHLDADLSGTLVDQTKYRIMVGALMYLTASRPNIVHATCYCARYQAKPTEKHLTAVKRIFQYLKNTINIGIWYPSDTGFELTAFSDSNHATCFDSRWRTQLTDYGFHFDKIPMYCDSKTAIAISCNPVQHSRTKHTDVRYHFIKEQVEKCIVELFFVGTEYQLADVFTKALPEDRFKYLVRQLDGKAGQDVKKKQQTRRKQRKEAEVSHDESEDEDHVPIPSSDPLPSGEDSFILNELMVFYTSLQEQVLNLQEAKVAQAKKITALKKKVSKLNKWRKSRSGGLRRLKKIGSGRKVKSPIEKDGLGAQEDASKQGRMIKEIDQNVEIALDDETQGRTNVDEMFRVNDLAGEEVVMKNITSVKDSTAPKTDVTEDEKQNVDENVKLVIDDFEVLKKCMEIVLDDGDEDKGKAKMIELGVSIKKKDQMRIDEEYARDLEVNNS